MEGKVCIVTGSNTGIGKETARGLAALGAKVILACRNLDKATTAQTAITASTGSTDVWVEELDLSSFASIRSFAQRIGDKFERLDVLVNNAGIWPVTRTLTQDRLESTFGVNHVGTQLLTQELLPLLKKSAPSRIVVLSSALHYRGKIDWEDIQGERKKFNGPKMYSHSKLMNMLFTKALARRLEGTGVTVNGVHPGLVQTELAREYPALVLKLLSLFTLTPEQGAQCSLHVATSPDLASVSGEYFEKSRVKKAAAAALDEAAQERLWELTERVLAQHAPTVA